MSTIVILYALCFLASAGALGYSIVMKRTEKTQHVVTKRKVNDSYSTITSVVDENDMIAGVTSGTSSVRQSSDDDLLIKTS